MLDDQALKTPGRRLPRVSPLQSQRVAAHGVARTRATSRSSSPTSPPSQKRARRDADGGRPRPQTRSAGSSATARRGSRARRRRASSPRFGASRRYLRREGAIADDPAALVGTPKREQTLPAHLSMRRDDGAARDAGSRRRRSGAATARSSSCSTRRAASERAGRARSGRRELRARMVRVLGKGGKERHGAVQQSAATAIRAYLTDREGLVARHAHTRCVDDEESIRDGACTRGRGKARQARRASRARPSPCIRCS